MPNISLFEPTVLQGVVEKFTAPESLELLSRTPKQPWPFPSATWDVIRGSRAVARPNVPNSEAHIVPRLGRSQESAAFIYLREKKVFSPTTLHWVRQPGTIAQTNAEAAVLREVGDLNVRFDNFAEYALWQMLTGHLHIDSDGDAPEVDVDYKYPSSHKPTVAHDWSNTTPDNIIADVRAWKRLISRDGRVVANEAYASELTLSYIFTSFATHGSTTAPSNIYGGGLLSDRMKDSYYTTGVLPGFMGINWHTQEAVFDSAGSAYTTNPSDPGAEDKFLADNALILGNFTDNQPIKLVEGPTADDDAPEGHTGKFSKTWKEQDPSQRQFLLEWGLLPINERPEQFVYVADVTA